MPVINARLGGAGGVGKSASLQRYAQNVFIGDYKPTQIFDTYKLNIPNYGFGSGNYEVNITDPAGQADWRIRLGAMAPTIFEGAHLVLMVYDVTRRETFEALYKEEVFSAKIVKKPQAVDPWITFIDKYAGPKNGIFDRRRVILLANKTDLKRVVNSEAGIKLAQESGFSGYFETSAKTGENIDTAFKLGIAEAITAAGMTTKDEYFAFARKINDVMTQSEKLKAKAAKLKYEPRHWIYTQTLKSK